MKEINEAEKEITEIIDSLKGTCSQNGMSNQGEEERIITTVFLYKFLNDKFVYNVKKFGTEVLRYDEDIAFEKVIDDADNYSAYIDAYPTEVLFHKEDTIEYLGRSLKNEKFYKLFDDALERISCYEENSAFNIESSDGTKKKMFEPISTNVDSSSKNGFAQSVFGAISDSEIDFGGLFENNFDFYSRIFEYLIKDYNVASGTYAEYFTPQVVSKIIAKILVGMSDKIVDSEIYDPSAGSGSLILHLANELGGEDGISHAYVYTQDISNKSSRFLRINLLLNGLSGSLHNVIQGDTLLNPAHFNVEGDSSSGLKTFDYIVANPPFNLDFSSTRDQIKTKWGDTCRETNKGSLKRFFAGVPSIPPKKKDDMSIYLLFIQHIIYSLKDSGKAAIVVPTGFLTKQLSIETAIRKKLVDEHWLKGAISMPSNIFANTGTNVSVLFIDKSNSDGEIMLIDASNLGEKRKEGKTQKTILSPDEIALIEDTFINKQVVEDFSVLVTYDQIKEKNYSFSAGQYIEVKIEYVELNENEFIEKMSEISSHLDKLFSDEKMIESKIRSEMELLVKSE